MSFSVRAVAVAIGLLFISSSTFAGAIYDHDDHPGNANPGNPQLPPQARVPFQAIMHANGQVFEPYVVEDPVTGDGKVNYRWTTEEFDITVDATLKIDPSISYAITFIDFGAPDTFTMSFSTPIVPTGPLTEVEGSVRAVVTDFTGNGASITPNPANGDPDGDTIIEAQYSYVGTGLPLTTMGVDVGGAAVFPAQVPPAPGAIYTYGSYATGTQIGPTGVWTSLHATLSFTFSGGEDIATFNGFARVDTIPEPSAVLLASIAGAAFAGRRVWRRKSA